MCVGYARMNTHKDRGNIISAYGHEKHSQKGVPANAEEHAAC